MAKAKITVAVTREIEFNPEYYPEDSTVEEMLEQELRYADEMFHEWIDAENVQFEIKGELIG